MIEMSADKEKITPSQYIFLVAGYVLGSTLLLSFMDNLVQQDSWMVIVAAFVACIPFVLSIALLAKRFAGKNFIDILGIIYGRFLGKAIFILYIGYFLLILSFNLMDLAGFYIGFIIPEAPFAGLLIIAMLVSGYAVRKGIRSISKIGFFSLIYTIVVVVFTFLLLIKDMDFRNFLPIFEAPLPALMQGTHIFTAIPFCEVVVFFMIMPSINENKSIGKNTISGIGIAALILLVITIRNTAVLGSSTSLYAGDSYQAARMINIGEFLTRVELITAIGITISLFIKICVIYYAFTNSVSQLLNMHSPFILIFPLGGIVIFLAIVGFDSTVSHNIAGMKYHAFTPLLVSFIIPPLSLLIAAIRGLPLKAGNRN